MCEKCKQVVCFCKFDEEVRNEAMKARKIIQKTNVLQNIDDVEF